METVLISWFNLSTRTMHVLQKMDIHNVEDFMRVPMEEFENIKGTGKKTIDELNNLRNQIISGEIDYEALASSSSRAGFGSDGEFELTEKQLEELSQYSIKTLELSIRSRNCLLRSGIFSLSQLVVLSDDELKEIPSLGQKCFIEIKEVTNRWVSENLSAITEERDYYDVLPDSEKELYEELARNLEKIIPYNPAALVRLCEANGIRINFEKKEHSYISENEYRRLLESVIEVKKGLEHYLRDYFYNKYIDRDELISDIDRDFDCSYLKNAILDIINNNSILYRIGNYYVLCRTSLKDYLISLDDNTKIQMVKDRLKGLSLQELGEKNNLTRERVRQITKKIIEKFPPLFEDYYSIVYKRFRFNKESFYDVFPKADECTFEYISIKYNKGEQEIEPENVQNYTGLFSDALNDYLSRKEAVKQVQKLTRQKIAWRVLILHSGEYYNKESFLSAYNQYLDVNDLDKDEYSFSMHSINNVFRNSAHVVFNREGEFRYYEEDATNLWNEIDFTRYKNLVISSELIYRDYLELMEKNCIYNGYELFCLLKNTANSDNLKKTSIKVSFRRIPMMIIGEGDEEKQAVKLVKELSPIDYQSYYEAYEERYGVRKESAMANIYGYIEKYHSGSEYVSDLPQLSFEDEMRLRRIIKEKPLWPIDELEFIFESNCTSSDIDTLNSTTLYNLGYTLNVGYAYSRVYSSGLECMEKYLFSGDLVNLNEIDPGIQRLSIFKTYIYSLRSSMDFVEISPKLYASKDFLEREYGLSYEKIHIIQSKISSYCTDKYFNANSIWKRIHDDPDVKLLKDNKWLCTSIMRQQEGFFSLSIADAVVLSRNKEDLNLAQICSWIVKQEGKMTLDHLTERINEVFGSRLDKYRIAFKLREYGNAEDILIDGVDKYLEQLISDSDDDDDFFKEEFL